ncbi:VWA domain-containing protein [Methylolobus aquaticus]
MSPVISKQIRADSGDPPARISLPRFRIACLGVALSGALLAAFGLTGSGAQPVYRAIVVVDITRSMNVRDYNGDAGPESRLDFAKKALLQAVRGLPCGSQLGLGLFTERRSALLFEPLEVCQGFEVLSAAVEQLDWRMAWAADSRIADGLVDALKTLPDTDTALAFVTDGQEAPPRNPRYRPALAEFVGKRHGIVLGVGGLALSPIPKFNEKGEPAGFYAAEEVPHRSSFGLPNRHPTEIEGYHERNAPFGSAWEIGNEHLSSLKEDYLKELAGEAGLVYRRLERPEDLPHALMLPDFSREQRVRTDLSAWPASLGLLALALTFMVEPLLLLAGRLRRPLLTNH